MPTPLHFYGPRGQLFGVYHPPLAEPQSSVAYLLCPPVGAALVRSHRIFRYLANRLARQGHPVLRFDWSATGESAGDCTEGCLRHWRRDVLAADQELRRLSRTSSIRWIGLQLGATVALQAAGTSPSPPAVVVGWDPVMHGAQWLEALAAGHARFMRHDFSRDWQPGNAGGASLDYFGIAIGKDLEAELRALTPSAMSTTLATATARPRTLLLDAGSATPLDAFEAPAQASHIRLTRVAAAENWNSDESMNTANVPLQTMAHVFEFLGDVG